jgi:hypothetical protein
MVTPKQTPKAIPSKRRTPVARESKTSPLLDWILSLSHDITAKDQALHPPDGARNFDRYLYGDTKED